MTRVLLTTTSLQDTPGGHQQMLAGSGWDLVRRRGPLDEETMLGLAGDFDAFLCGDDAITRRVVEKSGPRLRVISKYGIGVDRIDVAACTAAGIPVLFTPGVNHTTVAEHTFLLMLALARELLFHTDSTRSGGWNRRTGHDLSGKTIGIVGLGRVGREVALRARAFGMDVVGHGNHWDPAFAAQHGVRRAGSLEELLRVSDFVSLNTRLTPQSAGMIDAKSIAWMKRGVFLVNCARGGLVNTADLLEALHSRHIAGYAADVLEEEPPPPDYPLLRHPNCIVTPHIGSRTFESVARQATAAVANLTLALNGEKPLAQVNPEVPVRALQGSSR